MSAISVADYGANGPENIEKAVLKIGKSPDRKNVFAEIYKGKKLVKTVEDISTALDISTKRVLTAGKILAHNEIVKQVKINKKTGYEKIPFFIAHKNQILRLVTHPAQLDKMPTKRRPTIKLVFDKIKIPTSLIQAKRLFIDDIDSFKPKKIKTAATPINLATLTEDMFQKGIQKLIGEEGKFVDWGGEENDLFTTRVKYKGRRIQTAFAFKGPGKRGILTPKGMGKNGNQIQRLFKAPADLYILQYWSQIDQSVVEQVEAFAQVTSALQGKRIFFCVIDGQDTQRLVDSYPSYFT